MLHSLPDWLTCLLKEDRVLLINESVLEDRQLDKDPVRDFELEWQEHRSRKMSRTWGFEAKQRVEQLLLETSTSLSELRNLTILDAGCGNGLLTEAIAEQGAKVLGVDLINNLPQITHERRKSGNLFFLHADINHLPLKEASFDLIISNGVLHHTPDTKEAFLKLARLVKPGGKLYIWLYRRPFKFKNKLFLLGTDTLRKVVCILPKSLQKPLIEALTKLFYVLSRIRKGQNSSKEYNELLIDVYDSFTPRYRHYHNPIEVAGWFHEASFSSPTLSHWDNSFGFGMCAIKGKWRTMTAGENFGKKEFNAEIHLS